MACLFALLVFGAARATRRLLGTIATRRGGVVAILVAVIATTRMTTLVNAALEAGSPSGVDPIFQGAADRLQIPRD